jgi:hypothetical protein
MRVGFDQSRREIRRRGLAVAPFGVSCIGVKFLGAYHQTSLFLLTPSGQANWDRNSILLG